VTARLSSRSAAARSLGLPGAWISLVNVVSVEARSLRRPGHLSRGVLPSVMCLIECEFENSTRWRSRPTTAVEPHKKMVTKPIIK
jgi:hypothetical protein